MPYTGSILDTTTKNVVQEIIRECTNHDIPITHNFVVYYVKLLMLDPTWGITPDCMPNRNDVQNFVKYCVGKLQNQLSACIIALKMQLYFISNFENIDNMIIKNRTDLKGRLAPLEKEILDSQSENKEDKDRLFKKIVYLVTLYSGLGNPTIEAVYNEAEAALHSVLMEHDLKEFMSQPVWNKELQIVELTELVTGIRLFNRDCGKGGAGIEDLPRMLNQAIEATNNEIQKSLVQIMDHVNLYTTAIDNHYKMENDCLCLVLPSEINLEDFEQVKESLVVYRQYELFVRKILVEINDMERVAKETFEKLQAALLKLHETVRFRIAIPTIQVFPLFADVAHIWCQLQDQTIALSQFNQMLLNLYMYTKELVFDEKALHYMVGYQGPITDAERLEKTTGLTIAPMEHDATVLDPSNIKNFDKLSLQYLGFCAWKFIETEGGLIPGNPNMGVAQVLDKYYVFSSPEAAEAFGRHPSRYMLRGLNLARNKPELINLLQLQDQLLAVREIEKLVVPIPHATATSEVEVQTDLHPIPTKIDHKYMWNVWDWKRQALLLANLSRRATQSMQSEKSQAWNAIRTQTYDTKEVALQTKKDNYTNVPTLSNFIYGLRGRKDDIQHIITLTRPVDEQ